MIELVNEKTKAAINTTMEIYFIPTSELTTKYPLVMAGGDEIDPDLYRESCVLPRAGG